MEYSFPIIILGTFITTVIGFSFVFSITALFYKYFLKQKVNKNTLLLGSFFVMLGWLMSFIISLMFAADDGNYLFGATSFVLIFGFSFYISGFKLKLNKKDKLLYSLTLAVIMNPVWYFLLV